MNFANFAAAAVEAPVITDDTMVAVEIWKADISQADIDDIKATIPNVIDAVIAPFADEDDEGNGAHTHVSVEYRYVNATVNLLAAKFKDTKIVWSQISNATQ